MIVAASRLTRAADMVLEAEAMLQRLGVLDHTESRG